MDALKPLWKISIKSAFIRYIMKKYYMYSLLLLTVACKNEPKDKQVEQTEVSPISVSNLESPILGERTQGTVLILDKADGIPLFELYDNVLVESTPAQGGVVQILVYADLKPEEFNLEMLEEGRYLVAAGDTIGKVLKTHEVITGQGEKTYAMLMGYTALKNIKPETIIENDLAQKLQENNKDFSNWEGFIKKYDLSPEGFDYKNFESYYNYENSIEDPSPGFRVVLLFEAKKLVGIVHARPMNLNGFNTQKLDRGYRVSFVADFPQNQQKDFVNYVNTWLKNVD